MRTALFGFALLSFLFLGCVQTGPSEAEYALQTQVSRQATEIAALQDQQFRATWEAAETATMPPMPRVFLEISGSGDLVTENYEWGDCEKAVFYWSGSPVGRGGNMFVDLHKVGLEDYVSLVIETIYEPLEGETLQPLLGGPYYLAIQAPEVSWTIRGECQDPGTAPASSVSATPTELSPAPTEVPPTATPRVPTATPVPSVETVQRNETQQIGPIWDSLHDEDFSMEVTLKSIDWLRRDTYDEPRPGHVFVVVHLRIVNLGPGASRSISDMDFQVLDANGALRGTDLVMAAIDCRLGLVDLTVGGSVEGCAGFEVPDQGRVDLIYAPFRYEGLEPGRYLSFNLRP